MSKYSAEEVRIEASGLRAHGYVTGPAMLNAFAERIKAAEGAVAVLAAIQRDIDALGVAEIRSAELSALLAMRPVVPAPAPPARAAQVDALVTRNPSPNAAAPSVPSSPTVTLHVGAAATAEPAAQTDDDIAISNGSSENNDLQPTADPARHGYTDANGRFWAAEPVAQGEADHGSLTIAQTICNSLRERGDHLSISAATQLERVLAAQPRAAPDGWVLVPIELTPTMREAWYAQERIDVDLDWSALLAAAPSPGEPS